MRTKYFEPLQKLRARVCACLSWAFVKFCVCPSFPFGIEGRMWDMTVLIPDHCFSSYFDKFIFPIEN